MIVCFRVKVGPGRSCTVTVSGKALEVSSLPGRRNIGEALRLRVRPGSFVMTETPRRQLARRRRHARPGLI